MSTTFDVTVHSATAAPWEPHETIVHAYTVTIPGEYWMGADEDRVLSVDPDDMEAVVELARTMAGESTPGSYAPMTAPCFYDWTTVKTAAPVDEIVVVERVRTPGRPEIGPVVKVRVPQAVVAEVDRHAEAAGVSRAAWIRDLVVDAVQARRES